MLQLCLYSRWHRRVMPLPPELEQSGLQEPGNEEAACFLYSKLWNADFRKFAEIRRGARRHCFQTLRATRAICAVANNHRNLPSGPLEQAGNGRPGSGKRTAIMRPTVFGRWWQRDSHLPQRRTFRVRVWKARRTRHSSRPWWLERF